MSPTREVAAVRTDGFSPAAQDLENESRSAFNVRHNRPPQAPPVNKRLFQTPGPPHLKQTPSHRMPATPATTRVSLSRLHVDHTCLTTPRTRTPATVRRTPNVAALDATPGVQRNYVTREPDIWRDRQISDLTAWLNAELVDATRNATHLPLENIVDSPIFRKQFLGMNALYKSPRIHNVLGKVDGEIFKNRFRVGGSVCLAKDFHARDDLTRLFLDSYNPVWLLFAISVVLRIDLTPRLQEAFDGAKTVHDDIRVERVLESVLKFAIQEHLLSSKLPTSRTGTPRSTKRVSAGSQERHHLNAIALSKILHVILLLDTAKLSRERIIAADPPLFRYGSGISSSLEVVHHIERHYLQGQGDVIRYLKQREYIVSYETPVFERSQSMYVTDLMEDLIDGKRLCKLASLMIKDRTMLTELRKDNTDMPREQILGCYRANVGLALRKLQAYASAHMKGSFDWKGSHSDIVQKNKDGTLAIMWQIVSLWLEIVVLDNNRLKEELAEVQSQFRDWAKERSPDGAEILEVDPAKTSPTQLSVYQICDSASSSTLLRWCATVAGMYGIAIRDYTESFRDGAALCAILHHYRSNLIDFSEILHVRPAHLRSVTETQAERRVVQQNFDLFTQRCRVLGGMPHIPLCAEAALAPSFGSDDKRSSFGRVIEVLMSYLFRRLVIEEHGRTAQDLFASALRSKQTPRVFSPPREDSDARSSPVNGCDSPSEEDEDNEPRVDYCVAPEYRPLVTNAQSLAKNGAHVLGRSTSPFPEFDSCRTENDTTESAANGQNGSECSDLGGTTADSSSPKKLEEECPVPKTVSSDSCAEGLHQRSTDSSILLQAAVRGLLARRKVLIHSTAPPLRATSTEIHVLGSPLPVMSPQLERSKTAGKAVPDAGTSKILEETASILVSLRRHSEQRATFVNRMIQVEKNKAATTIQSSYRRHADAMSLRRAPKEMQEQEKNKGSFATLISGIPDIAKTFLRRGTAVAAEVGRVNLSIAEESLQAAAIAYEDEMKRIVAVDAARRERIRSQHYQRLQFASEEERETEFLKDDIASLRRSVFELDGKFEVLESYMNTVDSTEAMTSSDPRYQESLASPSGTEFPVDANSEEMEDSGNLASFDVSRELQEIRREEAETIGDLQALHQEWDIDIRRRGEQLRHWQGVVLSAATYAASNAFQLCMHELEVERSRSMHRRQLALSELSSMTRAEHQAGNALIDVETQQAMVDRRVSDAQRYLEGAVQKVETLICNSESLVDSLPSQNRSEDQDEEVLAEELCSSLGRFEEWKREANRMDADIKSLEAVSEEQELAEELDTIAANFGCSLGATDSNVDVVVDEMETPLSTTGAADSVSNQHVQSGDGFHERVFSSLEKKPTPSCQSRRVSGISAPAELLNIASSPAVVSHDESESLIRDLSRELDPLSIAQHGPLEMEELLKLRESGPGLLSLESAEHLESVLRRLSVATSVGTPLHGAAWHPPNTALRGESTLVPSVVKAIFIILRQCLRTREHLAIVKQGLSVLRNLGQNKSGLMDIIMAEDCVDILVNCVQFYKDDSAILCSALEMLVSIASHSVGEGLMREDENVVKRLQSVHDMMELEASREARYADRLMRLDVVVEAVRRRRDRASGHVSLAKEIEQLRQAHPPFSSARPSLGLLRELLDWFPNTTLGICQ